VKDLKSVIFPTSPGTFAKLYALMLLMVLPMNDRRVADVLRTDTSGADLHVGHWVGLIIAALVLVIVVASLWTTFTTALNNYSTNETTFGPTVKTIVPILVGVGILLAFVAAFLPERIGGGP